MRNRTYYKVVKVVNGRRISCAASEVDNLLDGVVEYREGMETKRKDNCGPLAVFNVLADAVHFIMYWRIVTMVPSSVEVWECLIKKSRHRVFRVGSILKRGRAIPSGTVFADRVMLVKEVPRDAVNKLFYAVTFAA